MQAIKGGSGPDGYSWTVPPYAWGGYESPTACMMCYCKKFVTNQQTGVQSSIGGFGEAECGKKPWYCC